MQPHIRNRLTDVAVLLAVIGLPLAGALWTGQSLSDYTQFPPPLEIPTDYPRFSWSAAIAVMAMLTLLAVSWKVGSTGGGIPSRFGPPRTAPAQSHWVRDDVPAVARHFPPWGWAALTWVFAWWILAWTRLPWFEELQRYTFFPLWLGFIIVVNALTFFRIGSCLITRNPPRWFKLFAVSAVFWWIFEWLNRFVHNWHYLAVEDFGPAGYALHATLCFSTVLPAVAAVQEWLRTHRGWLKATAAGPAWRWIESRVGAVMMISAGAGALVFTGAWPQFFYPALWVAPLAMLLATPILSRTPGVAHEIARGDWCRAASWMTAALVCGFFWELWNWKSLAQWIYTVPGVERWHVFEMPLLGYAGYLPFGLECLLVVEHILGRERMPATGSQLSGLPGADSVQP